MEGAAGTCWCVIVWTHVRFATASWLLRMIGKLGTAHLRVKEMKWMLPRAVYCSVLLAGTKDLRRSHPSLELLLPASTMQLMAGALSW